MAGLVPAIDVLPAVIGHLIVRRFVARPSQRVRATLCGVTASGGALAPVALRTPQTSARTTMGKGNRTRASAGAGRGSRHRCGSVGIERIDFARDGLVSFNVRRSSTGAGRSQKERRSARPLRSGSVFRLQRLQHASAPTPARRLIFLRKLWCCTVRGPALSILIGHGRSCRRGMRIRGTIFCYPSLRRTAFSFRRSAGGGIARGGAQNACRVCECARGRR
jgi:hypothetical protein